MANCLAGHARALNGHIINTIEWVLSELMRHPQVMKKVQKELEMLHPVAPLLIPHAANEDCTVNGFHIQKASRVIINVWAIGRDPRAWTDAEKFIPESFVGSNIDVRGNHFELMPFGSGRRRCPGIQLGLTVVQLMVAQLVHCFDWEHPNSMLPNDWI
ncbi:cytochrome P450 CYP736A12 [Prunus yedoensis var. nudiflora]|uniref:Cytochrome P450 CYP736A12 n=1 Tax=Prunus yedoensis var. nudiflora TaxID=2094558 RepID=A0A314YVD2_PRUYE|nr:cytochrome P450 CYP736A12 [Prunus yedoensis var. nudiflora]